jgi:hypothetical protein
MVVGYLPEDQLRNHTDGVEKAYQHSSFQTHLDTPCNRVGRASGPLIDSVVGVVQIANIVHFFAARLNTLAPTTNGT